MMAKPTKRKITNIAWTEYVIAKQFQGATPEDLIDYFIPAWFTAQELGFGDSLDINILYTLSHLKEINKAHEEIIKLWGYTDY